MTLKHVIVERLKPGMASQFEDLAMELRARMYDRGWVGYRAWRGLGDVDQGESPLFEFGMLSRATPDETIAVFEADFPDREALERQLHEMRNDPVVVKIMITAAELVDRSATRSYVFDAWTPPIPEG
jgi:hypothetical protein